MIRELLVIAYIATLMLFAAYYSGAAHEIVHRLPEAAPIPDELPVTCFDSVDCVSTWIRWHRTQEQQ